MSLKTVGRHHKKKPISSFRRSGNKKTLELLSMNMPTIVWLIIFCYLPMIGIIIAFKDYRYDLGMFGSEWVGFENFKFLFRSSIAWRITRNTIGMNLIFIISGPIFAVTFAILLNELTKKSIKIYQTVMFFPHYLSWVVVSYLFVSLFDMELGILNRVIESLGGEAILWYNRPELWPWILGFTNIWKTIGFGTVIYYTSIMGIDKNLYEAAAIDGAGKFQQARFITVPLLIPTVIVMTILKLGQIFRADFGMFYFLTKNTGALYPTTDVIDTYVFRTLRELGDISMGTATGLYQGVVGLILVVTANWIIRKINAESSLY